MRPFTQIKKQYCDMERINLLLSYCKERTIIYDKPDLSKVVYTEVYIWQESGCFNILGRYIEFPKIMHFKHMLDDREVIETVDVVDIIRGFRRHNEVHDIAKEQPQVKELSASPFNYSDKSREGKQIENCYCYDVNSAYGYFLKQDLPDTTKPLGPGLVGKGEIGFMDSGNVIYHTDKRTGGVELRQDMMLVEEGFYAEYRFPLMPSPYCQWVNNRYKEKVTAKTPQQKADAKKKLVCVVGALQNINPFIRITVVKRANAFIQSLRDENTVYCNTDSLVSTVKRDDIQFGTALGEFKLEHQGKFIYWGLNYEWEDGADRHSGKVIITHKFDKESWRVVSL